MNDWRQVKLGDVAQEVTVGHVGSMVHEYRPNGVPLLRSQNVRPHGFDLGDVKYISEEFHAKLWKSALSAGDVVTVRTGKPGATAVVPSQWEDANCSDLVITRTGSQINAYWLSYYINSAAAGYIDSQLVGAVQQHFNVGSAKNMTLHLPPLNEQQAIAEVLGALDDRIAANTKLVDQAEALARTLLVPFQPTVPLAEVVQHRKRSVNPSLLISPSVAHFSLPAFDSGQIPETVNPIEIKSSKFLVEQPSVLISKLNPRFPRVWDVAEVPSVPALASTELLVLEPSRSTTTFLWACLSQPRFGESLESKVAGTPGSHQRVKPADLLDTEVINPDEVTPELKAQVTAAGLLAQQGRTENQTLATTRDTLLPQLMSGKLRVKDASDVVGSLV